MTDSQKEKYIISKKKLNQIGNTLKFLYADELYISTLSCDNMIIKSSNEDQVEHNGVYCHNTYISKAKLFNISSCNQIFVTPYYKNNFVLMSNWLREEY